jgi:hypothetical protein
MKADANVNEVSGAAARREMVVGRDQRLDALRGLMLVIIAIFHVPNPVREFAYQTLGFVSEAEGFVFLSGYVAGLVFTRTVFDSGEKALWRRALRRARHIYLYHITAFVILWTVITLGVLKAEVFTAWVPRFFESPGMALLHGVVLVYQPRFLDILPMYCVFILITPVAIKMLMRGHSVALLSVSIGAWVCAQLGARDAVARLLFRGLPFDLGDFDFLAWQILFTAGLFLGFRRRVGATAGARSDRALFVCAYLLAVGLFALRQDLVLPTTSALLWPYASKTELGPLRLLNFAALALVVSHKLFWPENAPWVRWLAYLGRHSLQVFSFNIFCVYFLRGVLDPLEERGGWIQAGAALLCVITLPLPAWLHENRRRFAWAPKER